MSAPTYQRSPLAIWRATPWFLVAGLPGRPTIEISGSASLVWEELAEPLTVAELVDRLVASTAASPAVITADVDALLGHLVGAGLVQVAGEE